MAELSEGQVRERVRERYAAAAWSRGGVEGGRCSGGVACAPADAFGAAVYRKEHAEGATEAALDASLGCGVPTAVAELSEGETVLDLGSGAGAESRCRQLGRGARARRGSSIISSALSA